MIVAGPAWYQIGLCRLYGDWIFTGTEREWNQMTPPKIEPGNRPLKVCPFCGSQAILGFDRDQTTNQPIYPTVTCSADNCGVKMTGYDDNETLVRNWNRRTP